MLTKPTLLIFVILLTSNLTSTLRCYQCQQKNGVGDEGCDENPPWEKYLRECAQPQCWMRYSNNGTRHIERFCVAVADNMNGCMQVMVEDNYGRLHPGMECKCSNHDGCNGRTPHSKHRNRHGSGTGTRMRNNDYHY